MSTPVNDGFTVFRSAVRFEPKSNIRFVSEELRRYGIETNQKNEKGRTIFFQSAHILADFTQENLGSDALSPKFVLVNFKDLFTNIGKAEGVDDQDIVRTFEIALKLEKRSIINILGTNSELLDPQEEPKLPDVYANFTHIYKNDEAKKDMVYKSKFATNKCYKMINERKLIGISDFFVLV